MGIGSKLAVQMFTVRDFTKDRESFHETLGKIASIGYKAVQMSAVGCMNGESPSLSASEARKMLEGFGLRCIATHRSFDELRKNAAKEIEFHKALGCDFAAVGGIGQPYQETAEGYRAWIKDARTVVETLKAAGIRFGHHNHSKEFLRTAPHGPTLEDILIEEGGRDLMMELDLYWIANAGVNPCSILKRCAGRVPVIHLKDKEVLPGSNECCIAPIGEGVMEWAEIIPACERSGVEWYAIEQDVCRRDPFDCLRSSFEYLSKLPV